METQGATQPYGWDSIYKMLRERQLFKVVQNGKEQLKEALGVADYPDHIVFDWRYILTFDVDFSLQEVSAFSTQASPYFAILEKPILWRPNGSLIFYTSTSILLADASPFDFGKEIALAITYEHFLRTIRRPVSPPPSMPTSSVERSSTYTHASSHQVRAQYASPQLRLPQQQAQSASSHPKLPLQHAQAPAQTHPQTASSRVPPPPRLPSSNQAPVQPIRPPKVSCGNKRSAKQPEVINLEEPKRSRTVQ